MAQTATATPTAPAKAADAPDLGPDLGPELPPGAVVVTPDELATMVAEAVAAAMVPVKQITRPTRAQSNVVPSNPHDPPAEPTYEPAFIPTPEDWARFAEDTKAGKMVDEPVALAATIIAIAPNGTELECTPKAYRTLYRARGYVAHAEDVVRDQQRAAAPTRRRRGQTVAGDGTATPDMAVAAGRRRRRRNNDDD